MRKVSLNTLITDKENEQIIRSINPKKRSVKRRHIDSFNVSRRELRDVDFDLQRINKERYKRIKHIKRRKIRFD